MIADSDRTWPDQAGFVHVSGVWFGPGREGRPHREEVCVEPIPVDSPTSISDRAVLQCGGTRCSWRIGSGCPPRGGRCTPNSNDPSLTESTSRGTGTRHGSRRPSLTLPSRPWPKPTKPESPHVPNIVRAVTRHWRAVWDAFRTRRRSARCADLDLHRARRVGHPLVVGDDRSQSRLQELGRGQVDRIE